MAFTRVRTFKGKRYRYLEERWREGKKVRSRSTYLGAIGAAIGGALRVEGKAWDVTPEMLAALDARFAKDEAERQAFLKQLHDAYGLKMGPAVPVPVEKPVSSPLAAPPEQPQPAEQSPNGEQAKGS